MGYISIGRIINTHGLKGEAKIDCWSDFPEQRFGGSYPVYVKEGEQYVPLYPVRFRMHKGFPLVVFRGLENINLIEPYRNKELFVDEEDREELDDGEFYMDDLIGMKVYDEDRVLIGTVIAVEETNGANNYLRVEREGRKDALIPWVDRFIVDVDPEAMIIVIHVIEGLL